MTSPSTLRHELFCLPRPGESEVRTESYNAPRYAPDGVTTVSVARVHRCMECAAQTVDGQPVG